LFANFSEIRDAARMDADARVAVPMGHDESSVEALCTAAEELIATSVIFAPEAAFRLTVEAMGRPLPPGVEIVDTETEEAAALEAVKCVHRGEATILMKGFLKTSIFQKAILDKENGLRTGRVLSHVAVVHSPRQDRLMAITDGGMVIRPGEQEIAEIAENAAWVMRRLGCRSPKVALLAAIEVENEKMPETVLFAAVARKGIPGLDVQGPLAVDGAIDPEAARIKHLEGPVVGVADILITPDIASGNIFAKAFMYMTDTEVGGLIAGASAPVVMLSRSDAPRTKLNSLALGVVTGGAHG
jgi:phosphate butyryltransferase